MQKFTAVKARVEEDTDKTKGMSTTSLLLNFAIYFSKEEKSDLISCDVKIVIRAVAVSSLGKKVLKSDARPQDQ
ncbi:hypothetical protein E2C01_009662 [Portunus trituberculatus]|uniref:Uncharacterized protein n=1 Tax=Portunus trituberculatus TaxID=210409 RepID=A0A5B7D6D2_PORTR|nr:hypothetical protein [Portunus trituberculatus]